MLDAEAILTEWFPARAIRRVLLISPPDMDASLFRVDTARRRRYANFPPYGLAILAQRLRRIDIEVQILGLNHEVLKGCASETQPELFDFTQCWHQALVQRLSVFRPDLVGITCMFTMTHQIFRQVCLTVLGTGTPVVIGGVHVTNDVERVLDDVPGVHMAIVREGDLAVVHLIRVINRQEPASCLAQVIFNHPEWRVRVLTECRPTAEDLNILPAFDLLPISEYTRYGNVGAYFWLRGPATVGSTVLSNRGCRAQCTFCSVRTFNGPAVRQRAIVSVVDELERLQQDYGVSHVMWLDDDLLKDHRRAIALFEAMVARRLTMTWDATNGVIAASCTEPVIAAAAASGCIGLHIGMESGNPEILRRIKKPGTVETFMAAADVLHRYESIVANVFLMIGFPGETMSMIRDTIRVAQRMNLDWYRIFQLQPLPNTPIYDEMVRDGLIPDVGATRETRFMIGPYGKAQDVERGHRRMALTVKEIVDTLPASHVPTDDQLTDIWFYMDYALNYHRIWTETRTRKLTQQCHMLQHVCDVTAPENAFATYFLGVVQKRLAGTVEPAVTSRLQTQLQTSPYWARRFQDVGLGSEWVDKT